ncbi:MAG: bifunctional glutamate N-acetyltransferase/amino-acid acetyltransferase ArgJ [Epsilonproteobacteria bacterium]|nr:bifunctional glutamate N-acetyltransferase/amino-acid acetyltransferase ArgJ [Campylobacterota bacterium]
MFNIFPLKGGLENVEGFYFQGVNSNLKPNNEPDLGFIRSDEEVDVEALFTTNRFQAAPIKHFQKYPQDFKTNFLLVNSKNANAMTGEKGMEDIDDLFDTLKEKLPLKNPIMSSTGVIGYRLDKEKIKAAFDKFDFTKRDSDSIARAIMTTDSFKKEIAFRVETSDKESFHIAAICKGAGMINPAMATMLCFILTDANIPKSDMKELLSKHVETTFNAISVDGDTSTNDTVMLLTSRKSQNYDKEAFSEALRVVMQNLALMIVKDGEGANKVVAFEVKGAKNDKEAKIIAKALSNSLLVKTALFGEDPNWGRIASTIGASGCECDEEKLKIFYDNVLVYSNEKKEMDKETEERAFKVMKKDSFKIVCDLGIDEGSFTAYGCDLSYEYVKINADYRT